MADPTNLILDVITLLHAVHDMGMGSSLKDCELTGEDSRHNALIIMARDKCEEAIVLIDNTMVRKEVQHG